MELPEVCSWRPQSGPQKALIDCPFQEILFGGARGGGKTDGILGKWAIKALKYGSAFNGIFFRREMPQTDDLVERAKQIYLPIGGEWREQIKMFRMPGDGRIRFRPLLNEYDASKYQGQNLTDVAIEEAGNYPMSTPIDMIFGAMRSTAGVPIQMILTANPGGPGQGWIRDRYVDPAPLGMKPIRRKLPGNTLSHEYIYIPSKVYDNKIMLAADPGYIDRLRLVGNEELVRAWLDGDWSVVSGAFFPEFHVARHVMAPISLPRYWTKIRSFDWGSARPFSVLWWAVSDGELREIPRGCMVAYREWYGASAPNVGLKMTAEAVADGIVEREKSDGSILGIADPAIFAADGGPSISERMALSKCYFGPADNTRIARNGAIGGWDQFRARLVGNDSGPGMMIFSQCIQLIRHIPLAQHDRHHAEDLDSTGEDHDLDSARYAFMARPWQASLPEGSSGYNTRRRGSSGSGWTA